MPNFASPFSHNRLPQKAAKDISPADPPRNPLTRTSSMIDNRTKRKEGPIVIRCCRDLWWTSPCQNAGVKAVARSNGCSRARSGDAPAPPTGPHGGATSIHPGPSLRARTASDRWRQLRYSSCIWNPSINNQFSSRWQRVS